jgi:dihydrofolate synthase/folylpolyglutamate synthase
MKGVLSYFMDYQQAIDYIFSREKFGIKLGLNNMLQMMDKLGNPHRKFKSIHVAGSNGKGSTASFIAKILQNAGYKVGIYTSPHLVNFNERIRINDKSIGELDVVEILESIKPHVEDQTYFEVVTSLAFAYFAREKVDFAIIEVGLGGRLDATNVILPKVSVITNISFDHMQHLGNTLDKIAFEKAGIIKPNVPVIVSCDIESLNVFEEVAKKNNSKLIKSENFEKSISLSGEFQYKNAGLAVNVINELNSQKLTNISEELILKSLNDTFWPGRMQYVKSDLMFDCAHNPHAARLLTNELLKLNKNVWFIISIMADKDIENMCKEFAKVAKKVIITKAPLPRASEPSVIVDKMLNFSKDLDVEIIENISDALDYCNLKKEKDDLIVLTGSIFAVGEGFVSLGLKPFNSQKLMG